VTRKTALAGPAATFSGLHGEFNNAPQPTTPRGPSTHIVTSPCVVVRGARGSVGTFYEGMPVMSWPCADGYDSATPAELDRLVALGVIKVA